MGRGVWQSSEVQERRTWKLWCFWWLVSEGKLSVMQMLTGRCKYFCQNFVVHPKVFPGSSTKFHAFHLLPPFLPYPIMGLIRTLANLKSTFGNWLSPTPPSWKWKFQLSTGLKKFEVDFLGNWPSPPPPFQPLKMEFSAQDWT